MPVVFLTPSQRDNFGRYVGDPSPETLERFFYPVSYTHLDVYKRQGQRNVLPPAGFYSAAAALRSRSNGLLFHRRAQERLSSAGRPEPVSYTHLDVYKRQR